MREDIFDRIMSHKAFRPLYPFYKRYKEQLLYLFFGGLCTVVNIVSFWLVAKVVHPLTANVAAWVISVAFAYFTNRTWVFKSSNNRIWMEALKFVSGRISTLIMEEVILWIGIEMLGIENIIIKIIGQVVVVIGNYVISKWVVFKNGAME